MKKFISLLFIGAIAVVTYSSLPAKVELNDLLLENVEALASDEISGTIRCVGSGSVNCPIDNSQVNGVYRGYSLETGY